MAQIQAYHDTKTAKQRGWTGLALIEVCVHFGKAAQIYGLGD